MNLKKLLVLLVILCLAVAAAGCGKKVEPAIEQEPPGEEEVEEEVVEKGPEPLVIRSMEPVTVVINNHEAARPQSGLQQATLVYEFLVEGGITRFLAVYDAPYEEPFLIGPVRSLRPYFAEQAMEHGKAVAHSGYSTRTEQMIRGMGILQVTSGEYLFRDKSRKAPHNLYTDIEKLRKGAKRDDTVTERTVEPLKFPDEHEDGSIIEITYNANYNRVSYVYDEEKKVYLRYINGEPHTDRETGEQYFAQRVIIRKTRHENVPGPEALVDIYLDGTGDGFLYEGGHKYEIKWERTNRETRYFFLDGTRIELLPGTWIQVTRL